MNETPDSEFFGEKPYCSYYFECMNKTCERRRKFYNWNTLFQVFIKNLLIGYRHDIFYFLIWKYFSHLHRTLRLILYFLYFMQWAIFLCNLCGWKKCLLSRKNVQETLLFNKVKLSWIHWRHFCAGAHNAKWFFLITLRFAIYNSFDVKITFTCNTYNITWSHLMLVVFMWVLPHKDSIHFFLLIYLILFSSLLSFSHFFTVLHIHSNIFLYVC
jgi:hypothetical protein